MTSRTVRRFFKLELSGNLALSSLLQLLLLGGMGFTSSHFMPSLPLEDATLFGVLPGLLSSALGSCLLWRHAMNKQTAAIKRRPHGRR